MKDELPHVLIIIVTWNKQDYLRRLLGSIQRMSYANYSVLVVDNGSTDDTEAVVKEFAFANHKRLPENIGGAGGFNAGLRFALAGNYPYVWLLDDDTEVDKDALTKLVAYYRAVEHDGVAFLGSRINLLQRRELIQEVGGRLDIRRADVLPYCGLQSHPERDVYEVDVVAACSLFTSRKVLQDVGLINPSFFITCDDVEWSLRAKRKGYRNLVLSDAVVYHNFIWAGNKLFDDFRVYYHVRNFLQILQRYLSTPQFTYVLLRRLVLYFALAVHYTVAGHSSSLRSLGAAYRDYFLNRMGKKAFARNSRGGTPGPIPLPEGRVLCTVFLEDMSGLLAWLDSHPEQDVHVLSFRKGLNLFLRVPRREHHLTLRGLLSVFRDGYDVIICYERSLLFHVLALRFTRFFLVSEGRLVSLSPLERFWCGLKLTAVGTAWGIVHGLIYPAFLLKRLLGNCALTAATPGTIAGT